MSRLAFAVFVFLASSSSLLHADDDATSVSYKNLVLEDQPVAYWRFEQPDGKTTPSVKSLGTQIEGRVEGAVTFGHPGPRSKIYPLFDTENRAARFSTQRGYIVVKDPGEASPLDFGKGDSMTLEAWVNPDGLPRGDYAYIIGKGRTGRKGLPAENQNYAMRIHNRGGTLAINFLFRDEENKQRNDYHRWSSTSGFAADGGWHHIALTYTFGKGDSLRGYVDGQLVKGEWDMGGKTTEAPYVDNAEVWIGSSIKGNASSSFSGLIDEVAIYRRAISAERMALRYRAIVPEPPTLDELLAETSGDVVQVSIHERGIGDAFPKTLLDAETQYDDRAFGFVRMPHKYQDGVKTDRSNPSLLRATTKIELPAGKYRFLIRSRSGARLNVDGKPTVENGFMKRNASGHEEVPVAADLIDKTMVALVAGGQESVQDIELSAGWHHFDLQAIIGGKGQRSEIGELVVAFAKDGGPFRLLAPTSQYQLSLSDEAWFGYIRDARSHIANLDRAARRAATASDYWQRRHKLAKDVVDSRDPIATPGAIEGLPTHNVVDAFLNKQLAELELQPTTLTNDFEFLRRVTLDVKGVLPTREEITNFIEDQSPNRRAVVIDRLLNDDGWADHWVGYWQDVLAENPGILKPKLNNTGPFRWWIYESFLDNKPIDQFVTELIAMQGSTYEGGPAGFKMATQNDIPMAAKANVISQAFLGVNMQCARCHDAPYHPFKQAELLGIAAMLNRKAITLPKSSTVPIAEGARQPLVKVSLKPGAAIDAQWPFETLAKVDFPDGVVKNSKDQREILAAALTSPNNERFAQVIVNRLWHRYFGRGIVDPVDDWHEAEPSHPELLDYLAREFVSRGYDLKHAARLILNSHAYQRRSLQSEEEATEMLAHFAAPERRRMSAEQIVDSLYTAAGKSMDAEALTLDPEGRRGSDTFLNLGSPTRAWHLTSLSNERDRPALALPVAQSIVDVLSTFGWRDARPNPVTVRESTTTVLQPLTLANGTLPHRVTQISDNSDFTRLALQDDSTAEELVEQLFLQILSRPPTTEERELLSDLLSDGFEKRLTGKPPVMTRRKSMYVSWSNHLSAEATRIKQELERAARSGDPPTQQLEAVWRDKLEDVVWALVNSPEAIFVP